MVEHSKYIGTGDHMTDALEGVAQPASNDLAEQAVSEPVDIAYRQSVAAYVVDRKNHHGNLRFVFGGKLLQLTAECRNLKSKHQVKAIKITPDGEELGEVWLDLPFYDITTLINAYNEPEVALTAPASTSVKDIQLQRPKGMPSYLSLSPAKFIEGKWFED